MAASVARKGLPHFTGASFNGRTAFLYSAYIRSIRIAPTIGSVQAALPELFSPFWQSGKTLDGPDRRAFKATVAGSLPADVSGAVSLTKNDNGRGNAADGGPSAVPPSAHAERTFNHTPNAHGAITQRQSTGFASQKLRVRIPFVPPIPKCPSLRMAMAEMPMSGARGRDQLAKRLTRWQMRGLDGNDCTVRIQECQICRIVSQPSIAHGAALCGKFHGVCRDGME